MIIIKTSSLGDILQTFSALAFLKQHGPVDWVVEKRFAPLLHAHPDIRNVIEIDSKQWPKGLFTLRKTLRAHSYERLYDLQGNCKSGLITLLAKAKRKIGYTLKTASEWPNALATNTRYPQTSYLDFVKSTFPPAPFVFSGGQLKCAQKIDVPDNAIMICPGSRWPSKQLSTPTWQNLLSHIEAPRILIYGSEQEKQMVESLAQKGDLIFGNLAYPTWQHMMSKCRGVIAVDSSALHLCATTSTPSFSIFGPSHPDIYKPKGSNHAHFFATCPLGQTFTKRCPRLRTCSAPCTKAISEHDLTVSMYQWLETVSNYS